MEVTLKPNERIVKISKPTDVPDELKGLVLIKGKMLHFSDCDNFGGFYTYSTRCIGSTLKYSIDANGHPHLDYVYDPPVDVRVASDLKARDKAAVYGNA